MLYSYQYLWIELTTATIVGGLIGARLWEALKESSIAIGNPFDITQGSAWYGGFLTSTMLVVFLLVGKRLPILRTLDVMIPSVCVGQVCGRIGCFLSGDTCFGLPTNLPWGVILPDSRFQIPVHPTPIYEALSYCGIFFMLLYILHRRKGAGIVFASYMLMVGIVRFVIEFWRVNPRSFFGLTEAQIISVCLMITGLTSFAIRIFARDTSPITGQSTALRT